VSQERVIGEGKLELGSVRQLIQLLIEAREIPAGHQGRREFLISGVARIVGAAAGVAVLDTDDFTPGSRGHHAEIVLVGGDRAVLQRVLHPLIRAMMRITPREPGAAVTATWDELVTDRGWHGAERVAPCLRPACFADALFSSVRLRPPSQVHVMGLYRAREAAAFSAEERNFVHVFHAGCEGLLHASRDAGGGGDAPVRAFPRLSPRQRQALELVLGGLCDKEIAERLGISRYTVNQYTKAIYRHYAVTSRAQLLARVLVPAQAAPP
jgi:DNA-binding CsgD family transcriptional regulator